MRARIATLSALAVLWPACQPSDVVVPLTTVPPCGNGLVDDFETCDAADLRGESCDSLGLGTGCFESRESSRFQGGETRRTRGDTRCRADG